MTGRQRRFAEFYVQCGNVYQSAVQAGYSEKYASADACKILENPSVSAYIRDLSEKAQDERIMTAKARQVLLSDLARDPELAAADRIRAVDTRGKMTGEYVTKTELVATLDGEMSKLDALVRQMCDE